MALLKIIVIGDCGVGKSTLTIQFTQNLFVRDYDPTIENSYRTPISIDGQQEMLDVLDTAGDEYGCMRDRYLTSGQGFLLMYAINSRKSFANVNAYLDRIYRIKDSNDVPVIVVGNKCDLEDERTVSTAEAKQWAEGFGIHHFETSAKARINVKDPFLQVAREIKEAELKNNITPDYTYPVPKKKTKKECCIS